MQRGHWHYLHATDGETEAQRGHLEEPANPTRHHGHTPNSPIGLNVRDPRSQTIPDLASVWVGDHLGMSGAGGGVQVTGLLGTGREECLKKEEEDDLQGKLCQETQMAAAGEEEGGKDSTGIRLVSCLFCKEKEKSEAESAMS